MSMEREELPNRRIINWFPKKLENKNTFGEIEEVEDEVEKRYKRFSNFKIDTFPPCNHHYLLRRDVRKSRFRERIKQEWDRLYASTPILAFVRVYEHRIDLMRVAVTVPPGTDYQHCLFFFDIFFPGNYPSDPPEVHYRHHRSYSNPDRRRETWYDRLKQNLLGSSKKEGKESQEWDPKKSNILQVLDGIQNLVLDLIPGSLNVSNERSFISACEMMLAALSNPTVGFEDLVAGHFRRRAHRVLLAFKENGYEGEVMVDLFVKLFKAFERNGAYCKHHLDFLKSRNLTLEEVEGRMRRLTIEEEGTIRIPEGHHQEAALKEFEAYGGLRFS